MLFEIRSLSSWVHEMAPVIGAMFGCMGGLALPARKMALTSSKSWAYMPSREKYFFSKCFWMIGRLKSPAKLSKRRKHAWRPEQSSNPWHKIVLEVVKSQVSNQTGNMAEVMSWLTQCGDLDPQSFRGILQSRSQTIQISSPKHRI
jgi:hypothetical protein